MSKEKEIDILRSRLVCLKSLQTFHQQNMAYLPFKGSAKKLVSKSLHSRSVEIGQIKAKLEKFGA